MKRYKWSLAAAGLLVVLAGALVFWRGGGSPEASPAPGHGSAAEVRRQPGRTAKRDVVPSTIREISKPSAHLAERIEAVRNLPASLSEAEVDALIDLFRQEAPPNISEKEWYVILNEIMEVLRQPEYSWDGYGAVMGDLMIDPGVDPVVRDYASQYLSQWLGDPRNMSRLPQGAWDAAMNAYLAVISGDRESFEPVTGTSLMAMSDLYEKAGSSRFEAIKPQLSRILEEIVSGKRPSTLPNRISAIQAAGRMSVPQALPEIRRIARAADENPSLRLSSVAALGYFRDPSDRGYLEELAGSGDRLRFAAKEALRRHGP